MKSKEIYSLMFKKEKKKKKNLKNLNQSNVHAEVIWYLNRYVSRVKQTIFLAATKHFDQYSRYPSVFITSI